jgi:prephenate dehydrogenase
MDISSVKKGFVEEVLEVLPSDAGYVSLHPLFGPSVKRIEGEAVVVIPVRGEWALIKALELVKGSGLRAVVSSVEEHDKMMSIIQVAHHLSYLAYALTLAETMDPQLIERYATRSLCATLRMLKRMSKNFGVVKEIQELNVYGRAAKVHLLESLKKLIEADEDTWSKVKTSLESLASLRLR